MARDDRNLPNRSANWAGNMNPPYGIMITAPIIDACPVFTPQTYSQWKREVKLWIAAQNGASESQLLPELISVLPQPAKVSGLAYMERTEFAPETRKADEFMIIIDELFGKLIQKNPGHG